MTRKVLPCINKQDSSNAAAAGDADVDIQEIGQFFQTVGFPAAVAVYLLWRVQPLLQKLIDVSQRTLAVVEIMAALKCAKNDPVALERIRRISAGEKEAP